MPKKSSPDVLVFEPCKNRRSIKSEYLEAIVRKALVSVRDLEWVRNVKNRESAMDFANTIINWIAEARRQGTVLSIPLTKGRHLSTLRNEYRKEFNHSQAKRVLDVIIGDRRLVSEVKIGFNGFGDTTGRKTNLVPNHNILNHVDWLEDGRENMGRKYGRGGVKTAVVMKSVKGVERSVKSDDNKFLRVASATASKRVGSGVDIQYKRIFNDNTNVGGRIYAQYQSMKKEDRKKIKIDRMETVELDFKSNHLSMLHALCGAMTEREDLYQLGVDMGLTRDESKKVFMAIINSRRPVSVLTDNRKGDPILRIGKSDAGAIIRHIKEHDPVMAIIEGSGVGVALQKLEGDIAIGVMRRLHEKDIVCLPVHDSFIVAKKHEYELASAMTQVWDEVVGRYTSIDKLKEMCNYSMKYLQKKKRYEKKIKEMTA